MSQALEREKYLVQIIICIQYLAKQHFRGVSKLASVFTVQMVLSSRSTEALLPSPKIWNIQFVSHLVLGHLFQAEQHSGKTVSVTGRWRPHKRHAFCY